MWIGEEIVPVYETINTVESIKLTFSLDWDLFSVLKENGNY